MTTKRLLLAIAMVLFCLACVTPVLALEPPQGAAAQSAGKISALLPMAKVVRGAGKTAVTSEAKKGDPLQWEDLVRTEKGGRARITLNDNSILSVGSQSELRITKHDARSKQTTLELTYGRVRAEVTKVTRDGGKFEVKTPTAVAGVIGTDFGTISGPGETTFVCISGQVEINNPAVPGSVQCGPGQTTTVTQGNAPTPPKPATPEQILQLLMDTEPAEVSALAPSGVLPGMTVNAIASGAELGGVNQVSLVGEGVNANLMPGGSPTSLQVQLGVAGNAAPGPRVLSFAKADGDPSVAIFMVLEAPAPPANAKNAYGQLLMNEGQLAVTALQGLYETGVGFAQQQYDEVKLANAQLPQPLDMGQPENELNTRLAQLEQQYQASLQMINNAVSQAGSNFNQQYDQIRSQFGGPDDQLPPEFWTQIANLYEQTLVALQAQLAAANGAMAAAVNGTNLFAQQLHANWMKAIADAALAQQVAPVPAIGGPQTIEAGAVAVFSGLNSKPGAVGNIQAYLWEVCQPGTSCTPIAGFAGSEAEFNLSTCSLAPGQYPVRLTITDSNNKSASAVVPFEVLTPGYETPAQRVYTLAAMYSALQPESFLNLFDSSFAGLSVLQENIRRTFEQLASMSINLRSMQESINCSDGGAGIATVRTDWEAIYSFKFDPSQVIRDRVKQVTVRLVREPGRGWFITDLQGDNGQVQGAPPGPGAVDEASPNLQVISVTTGSLPAAAPQERNAPAPLLAVPPGSNTFTATVANTGPVPLTTPLSVRFTVAGSTTEAALPVPLAPGAQATVSATLDVNVPPGSDTTLEVTVNPTCAVPEEPSECADNTFLLSFTVGPPDYVITGVAFSGHPTGATGAGALQRFATHNLLVTVSNIGLGSVGETLTVSAECFPQPDCEPVPEVATFAAPAAGTSTVVSIPLGSLDITTGAYTAEVAITPSPIETNANNNSFSEPFEVFDFTLGVTRAFTPQNIGVDGVAGTLQQDVAGVGSSAPVAVPISTSGLPAGVTVTSAATVDSGASQNVSVSTSTSALAGTSATLTITGTRDGVSRNVTHDVKFYSASIQNRTSGQPGETAGSPLLIEKGATVSTDIEFQLVGDFFAPLGTANIGVDPNAAFTVLSLDSGSATPNGANFILSLQASGTAAETVTTVTVRANIPNTSPARQVTYTLHVLPFARPDLTITALAPQGGRDFTAAPWLSGEPVDVDVTVENVGGGASQSTTVNVSVNGSVVGTATVPALAAGASSVVAVHCVAPDPLFSSTFSSFFAELELSPQETNDSNQFSGFQTIHTSDWTVLGSSVSVAALANTDVVPSVRRSLDNSIVPNTLTWVPGNVSSFVSQTIGAGSPPTVNVAMGAALDGEYFSQVIAQMKDGAAVTAQRLGTITITVGTFAPPSVSVVSSVGNHVNTSPLQLNGPLPEKFDIQNNNIDVVSMDLLISDSNELTTSPNFIQNTTPGVAHQLTVAADVSAGGGVSTGATTSTVSAVAVQPVIILGEVKNTPVGTQNTTLHYNIGDVFASTNFCYDLPPGASSAEVVDIFASSGFNLPSVDWQWLNLPAGITVDVPSGSGNLSGGSYGTFNFQFANANTTPIDGYVEITFAITVQNVNGTATRLQTVTISRSPNTDCSAIGAPVKNGPRQAIPGTWVMGRAMGGGSLPAGGAAVTTGSLLPDVRVDAQEVSFTPSMPRAGDTVNVRFRLSNSGDADAIAVPVSLSVNGRIVATDTFDIPKGRSTLAGLEWNTSDPGHRSGGARSSRRGTIAAAGTALLLVDPSGTIRQKTTQAKSAPLPHFAMAEGRGSGISLARQRVILEVAEGSCAGLRLSSGAATTCGTGDVEITVSDLAEATYMISAREGIATVGTAMATAMPSDLSYATEAPVMPGYTYAVRLRGGEAVIITVEMIRNPRQTSARTGRVFGTGGRRATPGLGGSSTAAVETGDTSGTSGREGVVQFRISYESQ